MAATAVLADADLLNLVLQHLDVSAVGNLASTSTFLRTRCLDNRLWQRLLAHDYPAWEHVAGVPFYRYLYKKLHTHTPERPSSLQEMNAHDLQYVLELRIGDNLCPVDSWWRYSKRWETCGRALAVQSGPCALLDGRGFSVRLSDIDLEALDIYTPEGLTDANWEERMQEHLQWWSNDGRWDDTFYGGVAEGMNLTISLYHTPSRTVHRICDMIGVGGDNGHEPNWPDLFSFHRFGRSFHTDSGAKDQLRTEGMGYLQGMKWVPEFVLKFEGGKLHAAIEIYLEYSLRQSGCSNGDHSMGGGSGSSSYVSSDLFMQLVAGANWE